MEKRWFAPEARNTGFRSELIRRFNSSPSECSPVLFVSASSDCDLYPFVLIVSQVFNNFRKYSSTSSLLRHQYAPVLAGPATAPCSYVVTAAIMVSYCLVWR